MLSFERLQTGLLTTCGVGVVQHGRREVTHIDDQVTGPQER